MFKLCLPNEEGLVGEALTRASLELWEQPIDCVPHRGYRGALSRHPPLKK